MECRLCFSINPTFYVDYLVINFSSYIYIDIHIYIYIYIYNVNLRGRFFYRHILLKITGEDFEFSF